MSELLQSGHHPDADLLSAFVEQALPLHEREEMLTHLAVCPDCREVVALSLPEQLIPATPTVVLSPKSWFKRWSFVWVPAAVFATFAIAFINSRIAENHRNADSRFEISVVQPPEQAAARSQAPVPTRPAPPNPLVKSAPAKPASSSVGSAVTGQAVADLPVDGRNLTAMAPLAPATSNSLAAKKESAPSAESASAAPQPFTANHADGAAAGGPLRHSQPPFSPAAPSTAAANAINAPAPTPPAVQVNSAGANLTPLNSAGNFTIQAQAPQFLLPSNLPVLSTVSNGPQMLAIDSQNALFVSKDAGRHWEAVKSQWPGHAVRVSLVSTSNRPALDAAASASTFAARPKAALGTVQNVQFASLSGTVTDPVGAVIPRATVSAVNPTVTRRAETDSSGRYTFSELAPGVYNLTTEAPGFKPQSIGGLEVRASANSPANFTLQVAESSQTVEVSADALSIETAPQANKSLAKSKSVTPPADVFEITTDSGKVFTSADGRAWTEKK